MAAAYDTYDYPSYWEGRDYEHEAELIAIKAFLKKIPKIKTVLEIGAGYGRLTPTYEAHAEKIILTDPSSKSLRSAHDSFKSKKFRFIQSTAEKITNEVKSNSVDLVIMIRVLHHIKDLHKVFHATQTITKENGYLLLEFANKRHLKATISEFFKGNFTFPLDIFPKEVKTKKSLPAGRQEKKPLPFKNYHPDTITDLLRGHGYKIIETRSVSNVRNSFVKKVIPQKTLLSVEAFLQKPFAVYCLGPSIFVLAKKVK